MENIIRLKFKKYILNYQKKYRGEYPGFNNVITETNERCDNDEITKLQRKIYDRIITSLSKPEEDIPLTNKEIRDYQQKYLTAIQNTFFEEKKFFFLINFILIYIIKLNRIISSISLICIFNNFNFSFCKIKTIIYIIIF